MTREELIKKVALKMDEISSSDDIIVPVGTGDNNPLYTQINNLLNESVNDVLMKAPIYRLQNRVEKLSEDNISTGVLKSTRKTAIFKISDDFIRLVSITDTLFDRPVVDLAFEGDDVDKRQRNKFLVAKNAKPVAVIANTEEGRKITCYSYGSNQTPDPTLLYIKRYDNDTDTVSDTDLDDYMIDLVSWVCAGKVFAAQGDINKGKICDDNAAALMV